MNIFHYRSALFDLKFSGVIITPFQNAPHICFQLSHFAVDTPDPYVVVHVPDAPDGRKATAVCDNDVNPVWNEELLYLLPSDEAANIVAEVRNVC